MIKAVIFDLDNCVFDTSSMGDGVIESVFSPLAASTLPEDTKIAVRKALKTDPLNLVLERFAVPVSVGDAMRAAYCDMALPPERNASTYGDEDAIAALPILKFLVTTGYEKFQRSKIARLQIEHLFDEIIIDVLDDPRGIKGKARIFREILHAHQLTKEDVLVVGDNPRSELGAGKDLGIKVVQTLRPGVTKWDEADFYIAHLSELKSLIK